MKQAIISFLLLFQFCNMYSQEQIVFKLLPDGSFTSTQGNSYAVVNYDGQSSEDLYRKVRNNLNNAYEHPESVITDYPYSSIKVHGYMSLGKMSIVLIPRSLGGYYNIKFSFKDGKIRVDAPTFDDPLICTDGTLDPPAYPSFKSYAKDLFKNGKVKNSQVEKLSHLENTFNGIINYSLGLLKNSEDEDW